MSESLSDIDLTRPLAEIIRPMMEQGVAASGSDAAAIVLYDEANEKSAILQLITFQLSASFVSDFSLYPERLLNEALLGNDFIICNDVDKPHGLLQLERDEGVCSFICLPLCALGKKLGVACFYKKSKGDFSEVEITLLKMYGHILSHLVANNRIMAEAKPSPCATEQARAQEVPLHRMQSRQGKVPAVSQMAACVAYEINNPLAFVISNLHSLNHCFSMISVLLEKYYRLTHRSVPTNMDSALWEARAEIDRAECDACQFLVSREAPQIIRETLSGAERIRDIARKLLAFTCPVEGQRIPVSINHILDASLAALSHEQREKVKITRIYGDVPKIMGCADELGAALGNVISSAAQRISACGEIHINTQFVASTKDGMGEILISVQDNGMAIPGGERSGIFEYFFSASDASGDMALGLIASYGVVERYSGHMLVESATGVGSTFKIFLPVFPFSDHLA